MVAKDAQRESWKTILKNRLSDSLKKSQLPLSHGMMKKGDVFIVVTGP
jgi:hypothetical protein